jgi:hypothetical protein
LQVSTREATAAHLAPPSSPEANSAFFLLRQIGRMARSTVLLSSSIRPWECPEFRVRPVG